jgi:hypothetical protein
MSSVGRELRAIPIAILTAAILTLGLPLRGFAAPKQSHFWLAAQHDWAGKKGYFLVIENSYDVGAPSKTDDARLLLGVADGHDFRYLRSSDHLTLNRDYRAKAVIKADDAELWLDDKKIASAPGGFVPMDQLIANMVPSFLTGPSAYAVKESSLRITSGGKKVLERRIGDDNHTPQMDLWGTFGTISETLALQTPVTVEVTFRLVTRPDLRAASPMIDRYGQPIHANWPGKITSDEQLKQSIAEEDRRLAEWGEPKQLDRFGGSRAAAWKEQATGFFRVAQKRGQWWLISPEGNPSLYLGICAAPDLLWPPTPVNEREFLFEYLPPKTGAFADCWAREIWGDGDGQDYFSFHALNMIRKWDGGWKQRAVEQATRRASVLGFGGFGKWSTGSDVTTLPVLFHGDVPNLVKHPDIFDPATQAKLRESLEKQIAPRKDDPFVMGWSVGNEIDECISPDEVRKILAMDDKIPAARALREHLNGDVANVSDEQLERLRGFYADRYYAFVYKTVKSIDPNHLYFGFWPAIGYWINANDWRYVAPHVDVIGYDFYSRSFLDEPAKSLIEEFRKPVLCGEFSHPPDYSGQRGFGSYPSATRTDAEAGERYYEWIHDAATNPYVVGAFYFAYRDQPLAGRGPGKGPELVHGEDFAFGIVDVTDRPKWEFLAKVREANLKAVKWRLESLKDKE